MIMIYAICYAMAYAMCYAIKIKQDILLVACLLAGNDSYLPTFRLWGLAVIISDPKSQLQFIQQQWSSVTW